MRAYLSIFRMRLLSGLQYRSVFWFRILTRFLWGFFEVLAFMAVYRMGGDFSMTLQQTVTYMYMQQITYAMFSVVFGDGDIQAAVAKGDVATSLCRPMDLYGHWFSLACGTRLAAALVSLPAMIPALVMPAPFRMVLPGTGTICLFILSALLALGVTAACAMLMYISLFWLMSQRGIKVIVMAMTHFLSGGIIPLAFFPENIRRVLELSPFGAMMNAPLNIFCGVLTGRDVLPVLLLQAFWLIVLVGLGQVLMHRALRRVVIQGG
ncbi:MAG: ABC transporter permease [Oscillospiraceae bacterium]|nr:ABC transporter permease [Oscillospiraceae bacterium]